MFLSLCENYSKRINRFLFLIYCIFFYYFAVVAYDYRIEVICFRSLIFFKRAREIERERKN
jgi:hypothetical protein